MTNLLIKHISGGLRILVVYLLLLNIFMPDTIRFFYKFFPTIVDQSIITWSDSEANEEQEDERDFEDDREKEKENEIDKDFLTLQQYLDELIIRELNNSNNHFFEEPYPIQLFPIVLPPPQVA